MELKIKTSNIGNTDQLRDYLEQRITHAVLKFFSKDTPLVIDAEIAKQTHHEKGEVFYAEVTFTASGKKYRATATAESPTAAIDEMKDNLVHELGRNKQKIIHTMRESGAKMKDWMRGWWK